MHPFFAVSPVIVVTIVIRRNFVTAYIKSLLLQFWWWMKISSWLTCATNILEICAFGLKWESASLKVQLAYAFWIFQSIYHKRDLSMTHGNNSNLDSTVAQYHLVQLFGFWLSRVLMSHQAGTTAFKFVYRFLGCEADFLFSPICFQFA